MRLLLGLFLPGVVLAAAALVGPSLVAAPSGEPMLVAAPGESLLRPASFNGTDCASAFLSEGADEHGNYATGLRIVTMTIRDADGEVSAVIREIPIQGPAPTATLVVLVNAKGHIRFAGPMGELNGLAEQALDSACGASAASAGNI